MHISTVYILPHDAFAHAKPSISRSEDRNKKWSSLYTVEKEIALHLNAYVQYPKSSIPTYQSCLDVGSRRPSGAIHGWSWFGLPALLSYLIVPEHDICMVQMT